MRRPWTTASLWLVAVLTGCQTTSSPTSTLSPPAKTETPDLERSLVFFPAKYPDGDWTPRGLTFEDAWFESHDKTKLHGWYLDQERPRAWLLYCHGNGGNISYYTEALRVLHDQVRLAVFVFDYRGYGRSAGVPSESGVLADARAARAWLARRAQINERAIVLLGRSLGGGVAVDLAANDGARALVLESTFTSVPDVASNHYPLLPSKLLMRTRFDSLSKIARYHGPLLLSHGDADKVVAYDLGRKLFAAANEPKQFVSIPGGDHNDPQPDQFYAALVQFLDRLPPAAK